MKDHILNHLCFNGPCTRQQLRQVFANEITDASFLDAYLLNLRREGRIRRNQSKPSQFFYDEDFQCRQCGKNWPEVKRNGSSPNCIRCHSSKYHQPDEDNYLKTRFCQEEVGVAWAGKLAQQYLSGRFL